MFSKIFSTLAVLVLAEAALPQAHAQTQSSVAASYSGWYDSTGFHNPTNENYSVGTDSPYGPMTRNFVVFDLVGTVQPW